MPADPPMSAPPSTPAVAPAVAAVVVTRDPGPWLEETLEALLAQDYPNLSLLVVDAGSAEDPTGRIVSVAPDAYVRRLDAKVGFGAAVNAAVRMVEGASHFVICHDDVAPAPGAVRSLVAESFRSNAGIASPKYVEWDRPDRLVAVGATTDWAGTVRGLIEPGELDQAQHDGVRDILVAPGGLTLVRADLFDALGGFDTHEAGGDVDLSWKARLLGARLVVVPAATVRHMLTSAHEFSSEPAAGSALAEERRRKREQSRYRTVLTCYSWFNLAWTFPLALLWAMIEALILVGRGRGEDAWATVIAPAAALRQPGELLKERRVVQRNRRVGDGALRSLQAGTRGQAATFVRARVAHLNVSGSKSGIGSSAEGSSDAQAGVRRGGSAARVALVAFGLLVLVVGSRNIVGHGLPQVGQLPATSSGWASIWRSWWSGWQPSGLGVAAPATPALAVIGVAATLLFGAVGTLAQLLVLLPLVVGPLGAYRGARWWGSKRGQILAALAYGIVPLAYNSLSKGSWGGLIAYAAAPWVLSRVVELSAEVPIAPGRSANFFAKILSLGALLGATAAVAPSFFYATLLVGAGLIVGSVVAGRSRAVLRIAGTTAASVAAAFVLTLPWSATVIASSTAVGGPGLGSYGRLGWATVLRFHTGPYGSGAWEWLILVAASLALFLGRGWRLYWAARLWGVALVCWAVTWAGSRGFFPHMPPGVILAPAAASLAGAVALGAAAFEIDLPGYRFGWRQAAAGVALLCLTLSALPLVVASGGGHWDLPSESAASALAFIPGSSRGQYRVLWVGTPSSLPMASRPFEPGFAFATSFGSAPTLADDFATGSAGASTVLAMDLTGALRETTTRLGHLLAPAGIRYIVIPDHSGPSGSGSSAVPTPAALLAGLRLQTDLSPLNVGDTHYVVYENAAWSPVRSVLPASALPVAEAAGARQPTRALQQTDLSTAVPVLAGGDSGASGPVPSSGVVYVGYTRSADWTLSVGTRSLRSQPAFGWAMAFTLPEGQVTSTSAYLRYATPWAFRFLQVAEVVVWFVAAIVIVVSRRRLRRDTNVRTDPPDAWFQVARRPDGGRRNVIPRRRVPEVFVGDEESWVDG